MRLEGIDTLRGFAVIVVTLYHFFELLGLHNHTLYNNVYSIGQLGVPLFFIISGYLIYQSIDYNISNKGTKSGLKYYALHRLFRILPAYYVNFFIVFLLAHYLFHTMDTCSFSFTIKNIISHLTLSSYFIYKTSGMGINGAYWTLSIEMLWYMVAPLLFLFIHQQKYLIGLFILSLLYLIGLDSSLFDTLLSLNKSDANYLPLLFYWSFQLPGQLIYFIIGIFIYKYTTQKPIMHKYISYILSIAIIIIFIYLSNQSYFLQSLTIKNLITLSVVTLLFILFFQKNLKELFLLSWIGKISYSIYLWHMPILFIIKIYILPASLSWWSISFIFISILLVISSLSYYFIEKNAFRTLQMLKNKNITM